VKGTLLASLASVGIFAGMTWLFATRPMLPRVRVALGVWATATLALVVVYFLTPPDLGFLPAGLVGTPSWLDFLFAVFTLSASFFGGWLQLYNLASRGYSLRILIDLLCHPQTSATPEEVVDSYADGRGLDWMFEVRLAGLLQGAFVSDDDGEVMLTARGRTIARVFRRLRALYRVGADGG